MHATVASKANPYSKQARITCMGARRGDRSLIESVVASVLHLLHRGCCHKHNESREVSNKAVATLSTGTGLIDTTELKMVTVTSGC